MSWLLRKLRVRENSLGLLDFFYYPGIALALSPYKRNINKHGNKIYLADEMSWKNVLPIFMFWSYEITCYTYICMDYAQASSITGRILLTGITTFETLSCILLPIILIYQQKEFLNIFYSLVQIDKALTKYRVLLSFKLTNIVVVVATLLSLDMILVLILLKIVDDYSKPAYLIILDCISHYGGFEIRQIPMIFYFYTNVALVVRVRSIRVIIKGWNLVDLDDRVLEKDVGFLMQLRFKIVALSNSIGDIFFYPLLCNFICTILAIALYTASFFGVNEERQGELLVWFLGNFVISAAVVILTQVLSSEVKRTGAMTSQISLEKSRKVLTA